MAYPSLTLHLLISAPGDVSHDDLRVVREAIDTWNYTSGRWVVPTPVTVIPVQWGVHAYSQIGVRPQEAINKQFAEEADLALAMFADRLGTPTGKADSGTVEEIEVMRRAGKHVSLVHNTAPRALSGVNATAEKMRLEEYLQKVRDERLGLVFEYNDQVALARQIDLMLSGQSLAFSQAASRHIVTTEVESSWAVGKPERPSPDPSLGVWPTTEVVERPRTDNRGQVRVSRDWYLVLTNATGRPVKNVRFEYVVPDGEAFDLGSQEHEGIPFMPPGGSMRFPILQAMGSLNQADCVVTWQFDQPGGEEPLAGGQDHQTRATVRTV